jgi:hypothetical protein
VLTLAALAMPKRPLPSSQHNSPAEPTADLD